VHRERAGTGGTDGGPTDRIDDAATLSTVRESTDPRDSMTFCSADARWFDCRDCKHVFRVHSGTRR
jgi:hypothetical protein